MTAGDRQGLVSLAGNDVAGKGKRRGLRAGTGRLSRIVGPMAAYARQGARPPTISSTVGNCSAAGNRRKAGRLESSESLCPSCGSPIKGEQGFCETCASLPGTKPARSLLRLLSFARKRGWMAALGVVLDGRQHGRQHGAALPDEADARRRAGPLPERSGGQRSISFPGCWEGLPRRPSCPGC